MSQQPSQPRYESALVRFRRVRPGSESVTVGMGVAIGPSEILTCAHVVNAALGLAIHAQEWPVDVELEVEFLMLTGQPVRRAIVVSWLPPPGTHVGAGDVAGLRLTEPIPDGAVIARPSPTIPAPRSLLRTFGFPSHPARRVPIWADVRLMGPTSFGLHQLDSLLEQSIKVQAGYSGSPVWDDSTATFVGLLSAAAPAQTQYRDCYLISAGTLAQAWPEVLGYLTQQKNPYKGLGAFGADEHDLFFGRGADLDDLTERVLAEPVVAVVGGSGVGKSSLINAGLAARMREERTVVLLRPLEDPWLRLAEALLLAEQPDTYATFDEVTRRVAQMREHGLGPIARYFRSRGRPLLLIIDQFEEMFTPISRGKPVDDTFIQLLLEHDEFIDSDARIVIVVRADFLETLIERPGVGRMLGMFPLSPMTRPQLREAIERPAAQMNVRFEQALVDLIVADGLAGALPLVEFAMTELWQRQRHGELTHGAYRTLGGVAGALDMYAEKQVSQLPGPQRAQLDTVLLLLTRSNLGLTTRNRLFQHEVTSEQWDLLFRLSGDLTRLVAIDTSDDKAYAELAHEALLTSWPRLATLIAANQTFLTWLSDIDRRRRDDDQLSDVRIGDALRWLDEDPTRVPSAVATFIRANHVSSRHRQRRALAQLLSAAAETATDPQEGLLLAVEAMQLSSDPSAGRLVRRYLRQAGFGEEETTKTVPTEGFKSKRQRLSLHDWAAHGPSDGWTLGSAPEPELLVTAHGRASVVHEGTEVVLAPDGPFVTAAWSPLGACAATEAGLLVDVPFTLGSLSPRQINVGSPPMCLARDGQWIAVACEDATVRIISSGNVLTQTARLANLPGFIESIDLDAESRTLAAISQGGSLRAWDLDTAAVRCDAQLTPGRTSLSIQPQGSHAQVGSGPRAGSVAITNEALRAWAMTVVDPDRAVDRWSRWTVELGIDRAAYDLTDIESPPS